MSSRTHVMDDLYTCAALSYAGAMVAEQDRFVRALAAGDAHEAGESLKRLMLARAGYDRAMVALTEMKP